MQRFASFTISLPIFENPRSSRYSNSLALYHDQHCRVKVSQNTFKRPIESRVHRSVRVDVVSDPICVYARNELGAVVSKITAKPLGQSLGAMRIAFAKDYGGRPLAFSTGRETVIFEGLLHAGQVIPFWVRFEILSSDPETIDEFQIEIKVEFARLSGNGGVQNRTSSNTTQNGRIFNPEPEEYL